MARINNEELIEELKRKGLILHKDSEEYKSLNTELTVVCENNHIIKTTLKNIRLTKFSCPVCKGEGVNVFDTDDAVVPEKKGYRIISFDNATQKMGVAIFDDEKLVFYKLFIFSGSTLYRIATIRDFLMQTVIPEWKPDFIQIENIQLQNNYTVFETLVKLIGVFELACYDKKIEIEKTRSNVWRSHFGINGRGRDAEKQKSIEYVKQRYGINVVDDVAEAILIGQYRVEQSKKIDVNSLKKLF